MRTIQLKSVAVACAMGLTTGALFAQGSLPKAVDKVKGSVAQITLTLDSLNTIPLPPDLASLKEGPWIAGTGLLINQNGAVLTAAHVAIDIKRVSKRLDDLGIKYMVGVGFVGSNIDTKNEKVRSAVLTVGARIAGIDPEYDIAVLETGAIGISSRVDGIINLSSPTPLKFTLEKPRVGDEVFACGFPVGSRDLVTTSGSIASAEGFQPLNIAKDNGFPNPVDVYKVDLRISPGNSGGPLFRESDQAVLGIIVEGVSGGGFAIAVPSTEITAALTKHGIPWLPATAK